MGCQKSHETLKLDSWESRHVPRISQRKRERFISWSIGKEVTTHTRNEFRENFLPFPLSRCRMHYSFLYQTPWMEPLFWRRRSCQPSNPSRDATWPPWKRKLYLVHDSIKYFHFRWPFGTMTESDRHSGRAWSVSLWVLGCWPFLFREHLYPLIHNPSSRGQSSIQFNTPRCFHPMPVKIGKGPEFASGLRLQSSEYIPDFDLDVLWTHNLPVKITFHDAC